MTETLRPSWVVVEYTSNPSTQEAEAGDLKVSSRKKKKKISKICLGYRASSKPVWSQKECWR